MFLCLAMAPAGPSCDARSRHLRGDNIDREDDSFAGLYISRFRLYFRAESAIPPGVENGRHASDKVDKTLSLGKAMSMDRENARRDAVAPYELWSDLEGATWQVVAMLGTVDGRREVVGVTIRSAYDSTDGADLRFADLLPPSDGSGTVQPKPVTTKVLRAPFASLLERLRLQGIEPAPVAVSAPIRMDDAFIDFEFDDGEERSSGARINAQVVADVYLRAYADGLPPTQAVAAHFGISHDSAAARVRRARAKKLLPPAKRGAASGGGSPVRED